MFSYNFRNFKFVYSFDPELQLKDTEPAIENNLKKLTELRGFKFVTTLVLVFKKIAINDKTKDNMLYLQSKENILYNEIAINDVFESMYTTFVSNIQSPLGKGSG